MKSSQEKRLKPLRLKYGLTKRTKLVNHAHVVRLSVSIKPRTHARSAQTRLESVSLKSYTKCSCLHLLLKFWSPLSATHLHTKAMPQSGKLCLLLFHPEIRRKPPAVMQAYFLLHVIPSCNPTLPIYFVLSKVHLLAPDILFPFLFYFISGVMD